MKRIHSIIMALVAMTMLTSFVNMKVRKEDKSIENLWEDYRKAEQQDQVNKMTDVLEEIRMKARDERASWDFYDANVKYVTVKSRRNWKLRDSLNAQLRQEIEEYDEPLLSYLLNRDYFYDDKLVERALEDASRLRMGHNNDIYMKRGSVFSSAVPHSVRNDYEYVLWDLFRRQYNVSRGMGEEEVYRLLAEEVGDHYPQAGLAGYYHILSKDDGEEDDAALKALMDRYQGQALALLPAWTLIEKEFRKNQNTGTPEYFMDLMKRLESYEHERKMFKGGVDGRIADDLINSFRYLAEHLKSKAVQVKVKDGQAEIALRNLDKVKFRIAKEEETVFENVLENPVRSFYALDTLALELPKLDDGDYRIICLDGKDEIGRCHYPKFTLSVSIRDDSEGKRVYVADYKTGEPLEKVDMKLYKGDRLVEEAAGVELDGFTKLPENIASEISKGRSSFYLVCSAPGRDGTSRRSNDLHLSGNAVYGDKGSSAVQTMARVMLDRAAFKPGETVKFKVIVYEIAPDGKRSAARPGTEVSVRLRDPQHDVLEQYDLKLNEFGSAAGEFVLDEIKRNGNHTISVYSGDGRYISGSASFVVDEFLLPSFDVSFEEPDAPVLPGDTIVVKGRVESYSGHSLSAADVQAKVMYEDRLVKQEAVEVGPDGSFALAFVDTEDDEDSYGSYEVEVKVTDLTGETLSFYSRRNVMRKPRLGVSVTNPSEGSFELASDRAVPGVILGEDVARVSFALSDNGGREYAGLPLTYHLEKDGKKILEASALAGEVSETDMSDLESGLYKLVAEICLTDARGREITAQTQSFCSKVGDDDAMIDNSFENLFRVVDKEGIALQFGAGNGPVWAVVELFGDKGRLLLSELIRLEAGQMRTLKYDYKREYPEGVRLNVLYFRNSRCYTYSRVWRRPVPSNEIPIEIVRFKDQALPGAACSLEFRVPSGCEVLASVFDVSTERIMKNQWNTVPPILRLVSSVNYSSSAGMDGSRYASMMGDPLNAYNDGYHYDDVALGGDIVIGYGRPRRGLLRTKSVNAAADYVSVEEESVEEEAIPLQLAEQGVSLRQDFATTLAFEPFLRPSEDGLVNLEFKTSDKLSTFVVSLFAHDPEMKNSVLRREMLVTLPVKVDVVQPQYLYAGDEYVLNASVSSTSILPVRGVARLEVYASDSYEGMDPVMTASADVDVPAGGSVPVSFEIDAPSDMSVMGLKVTFVGAYEAEGAVNDVLVTDGVFVSVPVYPAEQTLMEAHSAVLLHGMSEEALVAELRNKFVNVSSAGAEYSSVSVMDMLRKALPLVVEAGARDVISQSEAMYVNLLSAGLRQAEGKPVREYVTAAMDAAGKVLACANADGGFGWFEGMKSSPIVTASVLDRFAGLRDRRLLNIVSEELGEDALDAYDAAVLAAVKYLDSVYFSDPDRPSWYGRVSLWQYMQVRTAYVGVPFDKEAAVKAVGGRKYRTFKKTVKALLTPKKGERWTDGAVLDKVRMIRVINALLGSSYGEELADAWGVKTSSKLRKSMAVELASLKEYVVEHPSGGMYYPNAVLPLRGLLESEAYAHAMVCDLFKELSSDPELGGGLAEMADAVRIWIMLQKETQQWSSDPGFVEAMASVYDGSEAVKETKVMILSKRYSKPFDQIQAAGNGFKVSVKYYRETASVGTEPERVELVEGDALRLGEKIVAVYSVWSEENRSFVRLSVPRPACFRPEMQLSGWSGGWFRPLAYGIYSVSPYAYREVKADRTLYWIDVFPEENSKIEETLFVTQEGTFTTPAAEIESLYASHYRANDGWDGLVKVIQD